jgi:hypothetical protein
VFAECRRHPGQWRRLVRTFTQSTAAQMASDVRSSYRRDPDKMRFRGVRANERWDAVWEADPADVSGDRCVMWVCFVGTGNATDGSDSNDRSETPRPAVELW